MSSNATTTTINSAAASVVGIALSVTMILSFFIFFISGSALAVVVFWMMLALSTVILVTYGFMPPMSFFESTTTRQPDAASQTRQIGNGIDGMEVFHINDNSFTYDEAPAVCAAYGANLATLEQVNEAYNHGAEWCGYGWSAGGLALYPTQRATWEYLQQESSSAKRTSCGRVGVNGGYFDPSSKFGANCYGYKPIATSPMKFPTPPPGTDDSVFQAAVNRFKNMMSSLTVAPYSRQMWSGYGSFGSNVNAAARYGSQYAQNLGQLGSNVENMENGPYTVEERDIVNLANRSQRLSVIDNPALIGPTGASGSAGRPGPTGPQGSSGSVGPAGTAGKDGAAGAAGPAGAAGAAGPVGPVGPKGDKGADGAPGKDGKDGKGFQAGVTFAKYGKDTRWAPTGPTTTVVRNLVQEGRGSGEMANYAGIGDPAYGTRKEIVIDWVDNSGKTHSIWNNGQSFGPDLPAALNRRFATSGEAQDVFWNNGYY